MEDPEPPSVQPKKKLLFKRTIQRKPAEQPKEDDDGTSLFSRANEFFPTVLQDRQREAAEKAEKERKEKLERERKAKEQERLRNQRLASQRHKVEEEEEAHDETPSAKKRRLRNTLSDDEHHDYDNDVFTTKPHKSRKSSAATPLRSPSPRRHRDSSSIARTPRSTRSSRVTRSGHHNPSSTGPVISIDSDDDDETKDVKPRRKRNSLSPLGHRKSPAKRRDSLEESDLELEPVVPSKSGGDGEEGDAAFDCYIQGALERAQRRKQARLAREASSSIGAGGGGGSQNSNRVGSSSTPQSSAAKPAAATAAAAEEPAVQILISSAVEGIHPIVFKRRLHQPLAVVHSTWVEQQVAKGAPVPRAVLQDMFFTWRGDKVYQTTTLETLGIRPVGGSGGGGGRGGAALSLYPAPRYGERDPPEGYFGRDKVHFEAWTQELYEEYLRRREKERRRARGELVSDDEDEEDAGGDEDDAEAGVMAGAEGRPRHRTASKEPPEKLVKIILKAKGMDPENVKARPSTAIATLALVFKRLKKLGPEANVELHWDGEVLDPSSTIEDAEIEDMDSIEVHIK